jgi:3-oxoacyl-[acyl-carrier protein] reductase
MSRRLADRIALVTGSARGIGREIAMALAREGADVAVNDIRRGPELESTADEIRKLDRHAWTLYADVSDEAAVSNMVGQLYRDAGRIDILVTNAGIASFSQLTTMTVVEWDRMMAVHLRGTFLCSRAVIPGMTLAGRGKIITIGSQLGQKGMAGMAHYSAAKGGVIAFTKALARELAPAGIQVNCIAPGPIETELQQLDADTHERVRASLPLGRFGTVGDVAPTAVFLASSESDYYTGQTLGPNGGDVML